VFVTEGDAGALFLASFHLTHTHAEDEWFCCKKVGKKTTQT